MRTERCFFLSHLSDYTDAITVTGRSGMDIFPFGIPFGNVNCTFSVRAEMSVIMYVSPFSVSTHAESDEPHTNF